MVEGTKRVFISLALAITSGSFLATLFFRAEAAPERFRNALVEESPGVSAAPGRQVRPPLEASRADRRTRSILRRSRSVRGQGPRASADASPKPVIVKAPPRPQPSRLRGRIVQVSGSPVARARVALHAHFAEGQDAVPIARAETDWEGRFVLEDVPACEEAWVEIDALYYLHYRGPSFSVPGGKDLDSGAVILHFGGSIDGEVVDGDGRRLAHAEVVLIPLQPTDSRPAPLSRTDSKGTFLTSSLGPGGYTLEIRTDGAAAATFPGLWIQADAPTVQIHLRLDGSALTFPEDQDPQQFRVYRAEKILAIGSRRFESLEEVQTYVDGMIASRWWSSEFREIEAIRVGMGEEETDLARGGADFFWDETEDAWASGPSGRIELPRWAWKELVVLHEVSHVLSPGSRHSQLFGRNLHRLVTQMLGEPAAVELALAYSAEGVSW